CTRETVVDWYFDVW
nr:immunoglobulin heavy chain junction region [Mus musculus]MBK4190128.1 immunoglobulin heavy chain junction region [Mus musculus]MBK4190132.1 immunoglobulin heavy chain junction region [Mus musculus]